VPAHDLDVARGERDGVVAEVRRAVVRRESTESFIFGGWMDACWWRFVYFVLVSSSSLVLEYLHSSVEICCSIYRHIGFTVESPGKVLQKCNMAHYALKRALSSTGIGYPVDATSIQARMQH
jgi:hypothetical protein